MKEYSKEISIENDSISDQVKDRLALFFDINIWIDLADKRSQTAMCISAHLKRLVDEGKIFCPLFAPIFWELYKQEDDSIYRVGQLMEELSLNICFAHRREVFRKEVECFVYNVIRKDAMKLGTNDLYVPVAAYLSSRANIIFSEKWSEEDSNKFVKLCKNEVASLTVTKFLKIRMDFLKMKPHKSYSGNKPLPEIDEVCKKRAEVTRGSKQKMWRIEAKFAAKNYIAPVMKSIMATLSPTVKIEFLNYLNSLPRDRYNGCLETVLTHMPAIKNQIELQTVAGYDTNRKNTLNDILDIELVSVPLAYADAFVTRDKWLKYLLTNQSKLLTWNNTIYMYTLLELEDYLKKLFS